MKLIDKTGLEPDTPTGGKQVGGSGIYEIEGHPNAYHNYGGGKVPPVPTVKIPDWGTFKPGTLPQYDIDYNTDGFIYLEPYRVELKLQGGNYGPKATADPCDPITPLHGPRLPDLFAIQFDIPLPILGVVFSVQPSVTNYGGWYLGGGVSLGLPGVSFGPGWRGGGVTPMSLDSTLSGWAVGGNAGIYAGYGVSSSLSDGSLIHQPVATSPGGSAGPMYTVRLYPWSRVPDCPR
jgi:hypothetical protein